MTFPFEREQDNEMDHTVGAFSGSETFAVVGMTCSHCEHAVTQEVSRIAGVTAVRVELATGLVTVDSLSRISRDDLTRAIDEAGYTLSA